MNLYFRQQKKYDSIFDRQALGNAAEFKTYFQEDRKEMAIELEKHTQFLQVMGALKELPLKYQEVISLRYFEGKNNKEIAEILNIREGTVGSNPSL